MLSEKKTYEAIPSATEDKSLLTGIPSKEGRLSKVVPFVLAGGLVVLGFTSFANFSRSAEPTSANLELRALDPFSDFCWKDSYGRGVGKIPTECPGRDKLGLLCYSKCPKGYKRFGLDCHQECTEGFRDDGLFCRRAEYGRGAGHTKKDKCESKERKPCEKNGLLWYPKCDPGYKNVACCICRPHKPDCKALGYQGQFDLSCSKKIIFGDPIPMDCASDKEKDAGLCYPYCKNGYNGVGPVCWGNPPKNWSHCGMGAATSTPVCVSTIKDQILSVGEMAYNLATFGAGHVAKGTSQAAEQAKKFTELADEIDKFRDDVDFMRALKNGEVTTVGGDVRTLFAIFEDITGISEPADIIRIAAEVAAIFDPTGISGVVAAYSYPKCSAYFG